MAELGKFGVIGAFLPVLMDETAAETDRRNRQEAVLQRIAQGMTISDACSGLYSDEQIRTLRNEDGPFKAAWPIARAMGADARRELDESAAQRAARLAELKSRLVREAAESNPEILQSTLMQDLSKAIDQSIANEDRAVRLRRMTDGVDGKATVNTQVNVGVAFGAGASGDAASLPAPDLDGFLRVDLGLSGDLDYRRDVAGGIYRRAFWTLRHCFRDDVRRVVMAIGKGAMKTIVISVTLAREFQKLLAARDSAHPRRGVLNLSASGGEQAEMAVFTDLRRWLRGPWFTRLGAPSREAADHVEWTLPGGGVVCAHSGNSRSEGVEGIDWTAAGADEVCRLPERDNTRILSAAGLVGPVEDTMVSRCQAGGTYKLLVASWPEHQGDYLLSRDERDPGQIEMARRTGIKEDLTRSFLGEPITWAGGDAETARQRALAETPFCDYGTEVFISMDGTLVVHCPMWQVRPDADLESLRASYARDKFTFSARFGAWPVAEARTPFLVDPSIVTERANHARVHPIGPDGRFLDWFKGSDEFLYYGHVDAAVTRDRAGIAVAHYDQGRVVFDLLLEVEPPGNGGEIQLESLRQVLYAMDARGFSFAKVTCDGFEGFSMRQELEAHGIDAEYVSVDKTREAYESWRDGLRERRMDYYPSEALQACADSLIDTGKKVDHTPTGRKDLADACAAVYMMVMREHGGAGLIGNVM